MAAENKKVFALIAAAGLGRRMNSDINKQFIKIGRETVIEKTLGTFQEHRRIERICLAVQEKDIEACMDFLKEYPKLIKPVAGGAKRQDTVWNALSYMDATERPDIILIHDGARPFVSADVISRVIEGADIFGAAIPCVPVKDTIKRVREGLVERTLDRGSLCSVQTPQAFAFDLIFDAYKKALREGFYATDDAALVEKTGAGVHIVDGEYGNIKITTKEDLPVTSLWRCGTGFDAHAFGTERDLVLGGVIFPYERGLLGHSDADVLTHAVIDALLGASGLGDIGGHFPDTDDSFKGASSLDLLSRVGTIIFDEGYQIGNIDAVVIAQKPEIAPFVGQMKLNLGDALTIDPFKINIKGSTTEGLGFCGREEGIAAMASCMVYKKGRE